MEAAPSSIRPATQEDLPLIAEIERRCHLAPWTEDHFREELAKPYSRVWLLTDDETDSQMLGYVVFWTLMDEAQILNIVVDLPHRGLGHAKRMLQKVITTVAKTELKRVILDVRKSNTPAIQLYQRLGFTITQVRKGFYSNGEDGYQMTLELTGPRIDF
jgi:ribosomal-protein-alanine N-acetyltransferase